MLWVPASHPGQTLNYSRSGLISSDLRLQVSRAAADEINETRFEIGIGAYLSRLSCCVGMKAG